LRRRSGRLGGGRSVRGWVERVADAGIWDEVWVDEVGSGCGV
jgi:hypothetical protein